MYAKHGNARFVLLTFVIIVVRQCLESFFCCFRSDRYVFNFFNNSSYGNIVRNVLGLIANSFLVFFLHNLTQLLLFCFATRVVLKAVEMTLLCPAKEERRVTLGLLFVFCLRISLFFSGNGVHH